MHDHNSHQSLDFSGITEMQLMWILMIVMASHHAWMWWKMRKKKDCDCRH